MSIVMVLILVAVQLYLTWTFFHFPFVLLIPIGVRRSVVDRPTLDRRVECSIHSGPAERDQEAA